MRFNICALMVCVTVYRFVLLSPAFILLEHLLSACSGGFPKVMTEMDTFGGCWKVGWSLVGFSPIHDWYSSVTVVWRLCVILSLWIRVWPWHAWVSFSCWVIYSYSNPDHYPQLSYLSQSFFFSFFSSLSRRSLLVILSWYIGSVKSQCFI